jgi:hypothetical protein
MAVTLFYYPATAFMSLSLPIPAEQPGIQWAIDIDNAFDVVDSHTHAPGYGNLVPTAGLNINADLSFASYNATALRSSRYTSQLSTLTLGTDINCVYVVGGNLYYNNGAGQPIQITLGGTINVSAIGSITGLGGTTGSASYSSISSTFTFQSNTNTPAYMNTGPLIIGTNTVSPNTWTITPPAGLSASYTMTLPTATPSSTSFLTMTSGGTLAPSVSLTAGITGSMITNGTITGTQIAPSVVLAGNPTVSGSLAVDGSLAVTGNITALATNNNVVVSNTNAAKNLAIVRAYVGSSGTIINGEGLTAVFNGSNGYTITWTTPFADIPAVAGTIVSTSGEADEFFVNGLVPPTNTGCIILTGVATAFNIIAIGQV